MCRRWREKRKNERALSRRGVFERFEKGGERVHPHNVEGHLLVQFDFEKDVVDQLAFRVIYEHFLRFGARDGVRISVLDKNKLNLAKFKIKSSFFFTSIKVKSDKIVPL